MEHHKIFANSGGSPSQHPINGTDVPKSASNSDVNLAYSASPASIAVSLLEGCGEERLMKSARWTSYAGPDRELEVTSRVSVGTLTTSTSATGCAPVPLHLVMGAGFLPCYFP